MPTAVLLNSGGIDSRVCAAMLKDAGCWTVHSLFIDWNVRARPRANEAAAETAALYCDSHVEFTYPVDWAVYAEKVKKFTTPYATPVTTILGVQYAEYVGATYVVNGSTNVVNRTPDWNVKLGEVIAGNSFFGEKVLSFPVLGMTNDQITEKAMSLGVNLATTWSCSQYPACEECASCRRRKAQGL